MVPACRQPLWLGMLAAALLGLHPAGQPQAPAAPPAANHPVARPNLVLVLADDLRADAVGALGNPAVQTPNLDRLVERGFTFHHAYCLGGNSPAVCLPSRNMLLSGQSYFRWKGPYAPADGPNLPLALAEAGYATFHCGKRGNVAVEIERTFQTSSYLNDDQERRSGQPGREVVDRALAWLAKRPADQPFFLYLALEAPHDPRVADPEDRQRYDDASLPLPANYLPEHPFDNGELEVRDEKLAPWPRTPEEIRRHLGDYYGVITGLDRQVGRLLEALAQQGALENTIVVFSSDNGLALGSHGLMGKQSLYEHSMRVPLVVAGPGIEHGSSSELVYLLDLMPTLCELAGTPVPLAHDGLSLVPALRGQTGLRRQTLGLAYRDVQRAIRDARYKLIRYPKIDRVQLFDLEADPQETRDLSTDPSQAQRIAELTRELVRWQRAVGDELRVEPES